jgi:hypothetical protein
MESNRTVLGGPVRITKDDLQRFSFDRGVGFKTEQAGRRSCQLPEFACALNFFG